MREKFHENHENTVDLARKEIISTTVSNLSKRRWAKVQRAVPTRLIRRSVRIIRLRPRDQSPGRMPCAT